MKTSALVFLMSLMMISGCASMNEDTLPEPTVQEKQADVYYNQGTTDLVNKSYHQALTNLLKAKELDPKNSKIRTNLGMAYYFRDQIGLSISELKEAISIDKKNTDAKMNIATIYMEQNKIKEAKEMYQEVLGDLTYIALYRAHYNLAILNLKIGDRKSAFEELQLSIKEKDDYCQAHYKLGDMYTEEYKFKEAYKSYVESTKSTCVNLPEPHYAVAIALVNLGRYDEAKKKLEEIVEKFPKSNIKTLAQKKLRTLANEVREQSASNQENDLNSTINNDLPITETPKF